MKRIARLCISTCIIIIIHIKQEVPYIFQTKVILSNVLILLLFISSLLIFILKSDIPIKYLHYGTNEVKTEYNMPKHVSIVTILYYISH